MGEGLVVGAPNIVIDLDGHTLSSGLVLDPGAEEGFFAGVRNSGHTNVVVRGGTVTGFGYGVRLMAGATHNLVTDMTLRSGTPRPGSSSSTPTTGASATRCGTTPWRSTATAWRSSAGPRGRRSPRTPSRATSGARSTGSTPRTHTIEDNTVSGDTGDPLLDSDGGISFEASTDTVIAGNVLADIGDAAILHHRGFAPHRRRGQHDHPHVGLRRERGRLRRGHRPGQHPAHGGWRRRSASARPTTPSSRATTSGTTRAASS